MINLVRTNYVKRGAEAVTRFCGWRDLFKFLSKCDTPITGALFATLFETGCRISEGLQLDSSMFVENTDTLRIYSVPVLKKNHKLGKKRISKELQVILTPEQLERLDQYYEETKPQDKPKKEVFRTIPIPKKEPLVEAMMNWVHEQDGLLFPDLDRFEAYRMINGVDDAWWLHRIRSERATQLTIEYNYTIQDLMKFFNWSSPNIAARYVRLNPSDLEKKMA